PRKSSQQAPDKPRGKVDHRNDASIVEPCRPDDAEHANDLALLILERRNDQRGSRQRKKLVFRADEDMHALAALGEPKDLHEVALPAQAGKALAKALGVLEAVALVEQFGRAAHDKALLLALTPRPGRQPRLDHLVRQRVELGLGARELRLDPCPGLVE